MSTTLGRENLRLNFNLPLLLFVVLEIELRVFLYARRVILPGYFKLTFLAEKPVSSNISGWSPLTTFKRVPCSLLGSMMTRLRDVQAADKTAYGCVHDRFPRVYGHFD